jgi:hypothetical protein
MATWKFIPKQRTDKTEEPIATRFFSNETVGSVSNALIREAIQNNLDEVKDPTKPVRVRIFISGEKYSLKPDAYVKYLGGLIPHLTAPGNGIMPSSLPNFTNHMRYLVLEDFNTKGLEGDPAEYSFAGTRNKATQHNFYYFWRAMGMSGKLDNKMGSWGVGKSVFPAASCINSYFAVTVRDSDRRAYLIGQAVLKTHDRPDAPAECGYSPFGYYGEHKDDGFPMPQEDTNAIDQFAELFKLRRQVNNDSQNTGLSIIVPYVKDSIGIKSLLSATINQFFYPILLGKLEIEIQEEDNKVHLDKNLPQLQLQKFDFGDSEAGQAQNLSRMFDFTKWIIGLNESQIVVLKFKKAATAYEWRMQELFNDIDISTLRERFDNGEPLAFKVPMKFQPTGSEPQIKYFHAYIQKDSTLEEPENFFIRRYLNIAAIHSLRKKGVRGMVIISDDDLVTFFGQAEGPAHTGWHKDNFRSEYESTGECITFVQNSLQKLYQFLLRPAEGMDKKLLADFFFVEEPEEDYSTGSNAEKGKKKSDKKINLPTPKPTPFVVSKVAGGFRIVMNPDAPFNPEQLNIKVAYDRFDGNPFTKYSEFDFDLKRVGISTKLIRKISIDRNVISLEPESSDFELKVMGFDEKRDLVIDIQ